MACSLGTRGKAEKSISCGSSGTQSPASIRGDCGLLTGSGPADLSAANKVEVDSKPIVNQRVKRIVQFGIMLSFVPFLPPHISHVPPRQTASRPDSIRTDTSTM